MSEGHSSPDRRPRNRRGIPRPTARRDMARRMTTTVPRTFAAVPTDAGSNESSPSTIATHVAEPTLDDDWVRRTPPAALILPPPPQFADSLPQSRTKMRPFPGLVSFIPPNYINHRTNIFNAAAPSVSMPVCSSSRSHTTAPAMRPSHSYAAAVTTPAATRHAPRTFAQPNSSPDSPSLLPRSTIPHLVVECLPNWTGHFRTIAGELGHTPNARPYRKGVVFLPKTTEEYQTVQRCLIEAAAKDSAITWHCHSQDIQTAKVMQRRASNAPAQTTVLHTAQREDAAPRDDVTPTAAPVTTGIPDASPLPTAADNTNGETLRRRRCRRKRAPRPLRMESPGITSPQPRQTREADLRTSYSADQPPSPELLDVLRVLVEAITTGMAAYLKDKVAMPHAKKQYPWVQSRVWRTRAGGKPTRNPTPGK